MARRNCVQFVATPVSSAWSHSIFHGFRYYESSQTWGITRCCGKAFATPNQIFSSFKTIDSIVELCKQLWLKVFFYLVSPKGADVLLTNASEGVLHYHRLRNSLNNPKLWKWRVLCGWSWKTSGGTVAEHINRPEMRAIDTGLRSRLFKHRSFGSKLSTYLIPWSGCKS